MPNLRQLSDGKTILAYGTSEGASKGWDTRGRGRKAKPTSSNRARIAAPQGHNLRILPVETLGDKHTMGKRLINDYKKLGDVIVAKHKKLEDIEAVKSTWAKMLHFLRSLGEWHDAWGNVRDLIRESVEAIFIVGGLYHVPTIHKALLFAYHHVAPAVQAMATTIGASPIGLHLRFSGSTSLRNYVDGKSFISHRRGIGY